MKFHALDSRGEKLDSYSTGTPAVLQRYSSRTPLVLQLFFFGVPGVLPFPPWVVAVSGGGIAEGEDEDAGKSESEGE
jgi:hypothetical protein